MTYVEEKAKLTRVPKSECYRTRVRSKEGTSMFMDVIVCRPGQGFFAKSGLESLAPNLRGVADASVTAYLVDYNDHNSQMEFYYVAARATSREMLPDDEQELLPEWVGTHNAPTRHGHSGAILCQNGSVIGMHLGAFVKDTERKKNRYLDLSLLFTMLTQNPEVGRDDLKELLPPKEGETLDGIPKPGQGFANESSIHMKKRHLKKILKGDGTSFNRMLAMQRISDDLLNNQDFAKWVFYEAHDELMSEGYRSPIGSGDIDDWLSMVFDEEEQILEAEGFFDHGDEAKPTSALQKALKSLGDQKLTKRVLNAVEKLPKGKPPAKKTKVRIKRRVRKDPKFDNESKEQLSAIQMVTHGSQLQECEQKEEKPHKKKRDTQKMFEKWVERLTPYLKDIEILSKPLKEFYSNNKKYNKEQMALRKKYPGVFAKYAMPKVSEETFLSSLYHHVNKEPMGGEAEKVLSYPDAAKRLAEYFGTTWRPKYFTIDWLSLKDAEKMLIAGNILEGMDGTSSPGYPWSKSFRSISQVREKALGEALIAIIQGIDDLHRKMDGKDMETNFPTVLPHVKKEPHPTRKCVSEEFPQEKAPQYRTIVGFSIQAQAVETYIWAGFQEEHDAHNRAIVEGRKPGMTFGFPGVSWGATNEKSKEVSKYISRVYKQLSKEGKVSLYSTDIPGFEKRYSEEQEKAVLSYAIRTFAGSKKEDWLLAAKTWVEILKDMEFSVGRLKFRFKRLIQLSGRKMTCMGNSIARAIEAIRVDSVPFAMGDDCIEFSSETSEDLVARYAKMKVPLHEVQTNSPDDFTFCSHRWVKGKLPALVNVEKTLVSFCDKLKEPSRDLKMESFRGKYDALTTNPFPENEEKSKLWKEVREDLLDAFISNFE
jgi:hypothetical protein